jgi:hypothetical protein
MKSPDELITELEHLTDQFSKLSEMWADLVREQADYYHKHRQDHKSDTAVQKEFDRTEKGIEMQICKAKLRSKEKRMSYIKTALRLLDTQARNLL